MLVNYGRNQAYGKTSPIIQEYKNINENSIIKNNNFGLGDFCNLKIFPESLASNNNITVNVDLILNSNVSDYKIYFIIQDDTSRAFVHSVRTSKEISKQLLSNTYHIRLEIPPIWLKPGNYSMHFKLLSLDGKRTRITSPVIPFDVVYEVDNENTQGLLDPEIYWNIWS